MAKKKSRSQHRVDPVRVQEPAAPAAEQQVGLNQVGLTAEQFADIMRVFSKRLETLEINDPNSSARRRKSRSYSTYSRDNIINWLKNPTSNEKNLRNASIFLFQISPRYRRLCQSLAQMHRLSYVISPLNFNPRKADVDKFRKSYQKVANALELMNIRDEGHRIMTTVIRDGVFYGVHWLNSASSFTQKLDPDYCQITGIQDGTFQFKYDCASLTEDTLPMYPPQFADMYQASQQKGGERWQQVPYEIAVCIKEDPSILDYSIPPFAGAFPDLYTIEAVEELVEAANELDNYKLLHGRVETDDRGVPKMTLADVQTYYAMISANISKRIGLAISPFDMKDFSFERSGGATEVDLVSRSVDNFWSTVGSPSVLHGARNNTAGVTKLSIRNEETYVFALADQYARNINRFLKLKFGGAYSFKITFLPITVFNMDDMVGIYKNALNYGLAKSYYAASLEIPQYDIGGLDYIEDNVLDIDNALTPLKTSSTGGANGEEGAGRPESDETDLSESGEENRDAGTNDNQ